MSSSDPNVVKGTRKLTSANTMTNAVDFLVEQKVKNMVNTSDLVSVNAADQNGSDGPAGFGSATPLVTQVDGNNEAIAPATLPQLRYFRYQAGDCAFIVDPQPGDKCCAVYQKRDSSGVGVDTSEAVQPGSFRSFDQADGVLFPSVQGKQPKCWVHLTPDRNIDVSTDTAVITIKIRESGNIDIETASGDIGLKATGKIRLDAPLIEITGHLEQTGEASGDPSSFLGGFTNEGGVITSNSVTLETHTHSGVESGGGNTGSPNGGT